MQGVSPIRAQPVGGNARAPGYHGGQRRHGLQVLLINERQKLAVERIRAHANGQRIQYGLAIRPREAPTLILEFQNAGIVDRHQGCLTMTSRLGRRH